MRMPHRGGRILSTFTRSIYPMTESERVRLTSFFAQYLSENKLTLIDKILEQRTRHITVVLEDIYQSQNGSAVIRTCECMGLQDVHITETSSKYSVNRRVLKGANKWLDLIKYNAKGKNNSEGCFQELHRRGYKIFVTDPAGGQSIHDLPVDDRIAIVMGNELHGASDYAMANADGKVNIPMYGFTESLNISVSAAICLSTLAPKIRSSSVAWQLSEEEKADLRLKWYRRCLRNVDILEKEFWKRQGQLTN
jgi:tRNA (guanosine-2'-O-)-methyltransferase